MTRAGTLPFHGSLARGIPYPGKCLPPSGAGPILVPGLRFALPRTSPDRYGSMQYLRFRLTGFAVLAALVAVTRARSVEEPTVQNEAPAPPRIAASQVVLWVRSASEEELRLPADSASVLRLMVRRGVSFPSANRLERSRLLEAARRLGQELGSAFREVQLGSAGKSGALAELASTLGKPPPITPEEEKALERLGKGTAGSDLEGSPPAGASPTEEEPSAEDDPAVAAVASLAGALREKSRWVLALDGGASTESAAGLDRDMLLGEIIRAVFKVDTRGEKRSGDEPPRRTLVLLLLVETRSPVLVIMGPAFKKGRIHRERLTLADLMAGLRRLLALHERKNDPAASPGRSPGEAGGSADWITGAMVELQTGGSDER